MTLQEAIKLLTDHQQWRLGNDDFPMQIPSEITKALHIVLNHFQQEISDEEIENISDKDIMIEAARRGYADLNISAGSFQLGALWYREQLKKKQ